MFFAANYRDTFWYRIRQKRPLIPLLLISLLIILCVLSLFLGSKSIAFDTVVDSLLNRSAGSESIIINGSRVPRMLAGLVCGAALAVAGAIIQALTRNALADPGVLGVNSGASFGVLLGIAYFGAQGIEQYMWYALSGALVTSLMVFGISSFQGKGLNPLRLLLTGVALTAVISGFSSGITLLDVAAFDDMRFWEAGTLDVRDNTLIGVASVPIVIGLIIAVLIAQPLNNLSMGEELALGLGTRVKTTQFMCLLSITLLCGGATALAGPIGFIGLMVPHLARWLVGSSQRNIVLMSMILGPILLITADIVGRLLVATELRVSVVTAFIGAPILIILVRRGGGFGKL